MASVSTDSPVYIGIWRDYDCSFSQSYRLTLTSQNARFLRSTIVILVALAGNRLWKFLAFALYRLAHAIRPRFMKVEKEAYGQQAALGEEQVIIRNAETSAGAVLGLASLFLSSQHGRQTPSKTLFRIASVFFAALFSALFIAAGLFTSFVDIGSMVLSTPSAECLSGFQISRHMNGDGLHRSFAFKNEEAANTNADLLGLYSKYERSGVVDADLHVRSCMDGRGRSMEGVGQSCGGLYDFPYRIGHLPCTFRNGGNDFCREDYKDNGLFLETGKVTFSNIGFNGPDFDAYTVMRRTECFPIAYTSFLYSKGNGTDYSRPSSFDPMRFNVAPVIDSLHRLGVAKSSFGEFAFSRGRFTPGENSTRTFSRSSLTKLDTLEQSADVFVDGLESSEPGERCFPPLCAREKAMDLSIITIHSPLMSTRRVRDAFFQTNSMDLYEEFLASSASKRMGISATTIPRNIWGHEAPISTVACNEMFRYCSELTGLCTSWTGSKAGEPGSVNNFTDSETYDNIARVLFPADKHAQVDNRTREVIHFIVDNFSQSQVGAAPSTLKFSAFLASDTLSSSILCGLPDNQWEKVIEHWFRISMTRFLRAPTQLFKTNKWATPFNDFLERTNIDRSGGHALCASIRFTSPNHTTFSLAGLVIIGMGVALCMVLSFVPQVVSWTYTRRGEEYDWVEDGAVELLRESWKEEEAQSSSSTPVDRYLDGKKEGFIAIKAQPGS